jgi:hypothetical protein
MHVTSGAGEFDISIARVVNDGKNVVMIGKMGLWEARLTLTPKEALSLARGMMLPLVKSLFA